MDYFHSLKTFKTIAVIGQDLNKAIRLFNAGEVVAIPTETVYGLASNALDPLAVAKIFEAKQRPFFDPLIVHVSDINEAKKWSRAIPEKLLVLMQKFSPGPLTVLVEKSDAIPDIVTAGLDTVGIRIPNHPLTLELLKNLPFPICAPSANPFGYVSPTTAFHVADQLGNKIPYILDGGSCNVGIESTIVSEKNGQVYIHRLGGLSIEEIEAEVGEVFLDINQHSNPKAPGMLDTHYAPQKLLLVGDIYELYHSTLGKKALISFSHAYNDLGFEEHIVLSEKKDFKEAAANLFSALRQLDKSDVDIILAEHFPEEGLGKAINDRLKRASAKR